MTNLSSYTTIPLLSAPSSFGWHPMTRSWSYDVSHVKDDEATLSPTVTVRDSESRQMFLMAIHPT